MVIGAGAQFEQLDNKYKPKKLKLLGTLKSCGALAQ